MGHLFKQRVDEPLTNSLQQGKRFFFLYGDGIKDLFLEDICNGVVSLKENVQNCFLNRDDCEIFVTVNTDGVTVLRKRENEIIDISSNYLKLPDKENSDMPDDEEEGDGEKNNGKSDEAKKLEENIKKSGTDIINSIGIVKLHSQDKMVSEKKTAIFFEDFEWLAKLYSSSNNDTLEYIKLLKDFYKINECYTIVSLEDVDLLKKYSFEVKGSNVIYLGNPSADEVKYTYLLKFLGNTDFNKQNVQLDLFDQIKKISQAISSSKKSLREAIQVLETIVLDKKSNKIDSTDFEIAIEKITAEKVGLKDVIINSSEKKKIVDAIEAFVEGENTSEYRKGFILTGPPGTGKTQIVKALSNDYNVYFMAPKLSELKGEYIGQTSGKVKRIFDEARANSPTIIFIDEADTVFPSRNLGAGMSDSFNLDMVNQFLQEIDGITSGKNKIFIIAATNRVNIIDEAIQSRLTERIYIGLPSAENRMKIFNQKLEKYSFTFNGKVYYNEIQAKTVNMSGRDIENFVKMLNERIKASKFKKISNLGNDNESRNQILRVLEINEQKLIADLQKEVPVQVLEPSDISMKISDIIGYDSIKERIQRQADYIKYSEENKSNALKFGVKISKGIMLYGPPGNAKTMLAQAVAKDNNFYFVKVLSKDFTSDSISKQLDNLQVIFDQVIRLSKMCSKHDGVILFFDEFDSLAYYGMSNVIRGTLLDYLASGDNQEDEGIRSAQSRILLMVATNFKEKLDPAVIRKGRVDDHLLMDNPTEYAGIKMLEQKIERDQSVECKEDVDLSDVYERLTKYVRNQVIVADEKDKENIRPSGSAIIHLFDELKYEAYFNAVSLNKPFDKLFLTQALITSHFESLF